MKSRIIDLTLDQLLAAVRDTVQQVLAEREAMKASKERYVYGIAGIMQLYHCSRSTANRIKKSGRIDHAITQVGGKMVIDVELALHALPKR